LPGGVIAAEGHHVVVVEGDAPRPELRELFGIGAGVEGGPGGITELVLGLPTDGPQREGELICTGGRHCMLLIRGRRARAACWAALLCAPPARAPFCCSTQLIALLG